MPKKNRLKGFSLTNKIRNVIILPYNMFEFSRIKGGFFNAK